MFTSSSLPADFFWGYECVTNEPQRRSAGRLYFFWSKSISVNRIRSYYLSEFIALL